MIKQDQYEYRYRPAVECYSAATWALGGAICISIGLQRWPAMEFYIYIGILFLGLAIWRACEVASMWLKRATLLGKPIETITVESLLAKGALQPDALWLGWGFAWKSVHTQRLHEIKKAGVDALYPPRWFIETIRKKYKLRMPGQIGSAWIHGVETIEKDIRFPIEHLIGNTGIFATNRSMKTRVLELIVTQLIHRNPKEPIIVLDPKGDRELEQRMRHEMKRAGREHEYFYFHPAFPESCFRWDPLRNWNQVTGLASRMAALIGNQDIFTAFSWRVINTIAQGLVEIETRPNLEKFRRYIIGGPDQLLLNVLRAYMTRKVPNWEEESRSYVARARSNKIRGPSPNTPIELIGLVAYYKEHLADSHGSSVVDGLISMYEHSRDHLVKLIASLMPILDMLTSGDMAKLLSPDTDDHNDTRPIIDSKKIVEGGYVVYMGLDSLSDTTTGAAIGSLGLADFAAAAGDFYNHGTNRKVTIIIDEAAEVINMPLIQLLNKGGGAGFRLIIAAQTVPDFVARLGNEALALQMLGNINNLIAGRTKDGKTTEYIMDTFGTTYIKSIAPSQTRNPTPSGSEFGIQSNNFSERLTEEETELFSTDMLGQFPNLEFIGCFSGGRIEKVRFPPLESIESELKRTEPSLDQR